ncbi:hypothetical protein [Streptomyces sp. NPDC001250]
MSVVVLLVLLGPVPNWRRVVLMTGSLPSPADTADTASDTADTDAR